MALDAGAPAEGPEGPNPATRRVPAGSSPLALIRFLWDEAPLQGRLLAGGSLAFALVGVILSWGVGFWSLLPMVLALTLVSLLLATLARNNSLPGKVLSWVMVALLSAVMSLFVSCAFFGVPERGTLLLARWLDAPEIAVSPLRGTAAEVRVDLAGASMTLQELQSRVPQIADPSSGGDRTAIMSALSKLPQVYISNGTLVMPPTGNFSIRARAIRLNNATIQLNASSLEIEALEFISTNGRIFAFPDGSSTRTEQNGRNAGSLTLKVYQRISGLLPVVLRGEPGLNGVKGSTGGEGSAGAQGAQGVSTAVDCRAGPGTGERGGSGGAGSPGTRGGNGGAGGTLTVALPHGAQWPGPTPVLNGGPAGTAGPGGDGGPGGPGGRGGEPNGWCRGNGPTGAQGPTGPAGPPGEAGTQGADGQFVVNQIGT
jgi:hypothetical protein